MTFKANRLCIETTITSLDKYKTFIFFEMKVDSDHVFEMQCNVASVLFFCFLLQAWTEQKKRILTCT